MNQQLNEVVCFGVDVASTHLDIAVHGVQQVQRIPNDERSINRWLKTVARSSRLAVEATGSYHQLLARLAHEHGLQVFVLNPRDVKRYAQGLGQRGKTDRLDALVIARFIHREHQELRVWQPPTKEAQRLDDLLRTRALLQKQYAAQKQSLVHRPELEQVIEDVLQSMQAALTRLETLIAQAARNLPEGRAGLRCIMSIPGVGVLTGAALLQLFTRAKDASCDAVVALTGLDPRPMDSGSRKGIRRLSKRGNAEMRRLLYNAAMSGARTLTWRGVYERERAKGLPATGALIALARRLVRVAFSLFKSHSMFDQTRVCA